MSSYLLAAFTATLEDYNMDENIFRKKAGTKSLRKKYLKQYNLARKYLREDGAAGEEDGEGP